MKRTVHKRMLPMVFLIVVLAAVLALCAWIFGWGRGDINVMDFSANEVDRIELSCTDIHVDMHRAVVTEKDDIQAFINSVNSFQHTGSNIKYLFRYGIGAGGAVLYECDVYFSSGDIFNLRFANGNGEQDLSDMEVSYWIPQENQKRLFSDTCRGSMELFYELYERYNITE